MVCCSLILVFYFVVLEEGVGLGSVCFFFDCEGNLWVMCVVM